MASNTVNPQVPGSSPGRGAKITRLLALWHKADTQLLQFMRASYSCESCQRILHQHGNLEEIFFALMTYSQHGHRLTVLDFKQRNVAVCTKTDNQLAQERMFR